MILIVSANFPPEPIAAANISYDLATELSKEWKVTVLTPRPSRPCGFSFSHKANYSREFNHIILNSFTCPESKVLGRMYESYSFGKYAVQYIKKHHREITCVYVSVWPLFAQYMIVKASRRLALPTIVHIQDIYPESLANKLPFFRNFVNKALLPVDRYILKNASHIIANSEKMRFVFKSTRGIPFHKITTVKNWQDESKFILTQDPQVKTSISNNENKPFTFMYLGNIGPVAGVDFLIRSFIKANLEKCRLIIAGSGSQKERCMQISEFHKSTNIFFVDVPSGKVTETQNSADVMLLPIIKGASLSSIPSKLAAYMFSKKPIIACVENESDIAIGIREADCGWIVSPEDTDSLIIAMKDAISKSKKVLLQYGENGFNYALENYSRQKNLQLLVSTFSQCINN
jgi:glycosyltransferase involved in cell wall biosynthesis